VPAESTVAFVWVLTPFSVAVNGGMAKLAWALSA
jgi:hypothetical protein